ncbi:type IV toxin-antitoxin system AbiEi family antitoxin domain-containing protein [Rhodococcus triatomae]|uniref:Transcriptional regulator, AbiEi antitoxin, Type IV TA system n=1 Tax=Rhodococcus triatomae TaxID=300028 RepID=A0A1G8PQH6_9NOCA|nr:type IV toxin-antitoxin system AbiEi family antitoxin domain-containing protein [Rhodococcus triatomae]QNG20169.1 type IV toxin-antitoxin system AbiEi family antitoxin domain-containing protein [Rhodococcus triatomae]QNG23915.1 type IV toxin-antitoxin system AbiEi family antitoxin domain-containing protein [Rhodococcus triatomae]SDI94717.1 Transcriptional regulator, AbiEi antitoxin, Type IV TA system [Rhodococcus triatomae]
MGEPSIITRESARSRGLSDREIRRLVDSGTWVRVIRGVYVPRSAYTALDVVERHRLLCEATVSVGGDLVLSHVSAAILHGFTVWNVPLERAHVIRDKPTGNSISNSRIVHAGRLAPGDVTDLRGTAVTTPARTVADLAATLPFEQALVIGDHALRTAHLVPEDIAHALHPSHPGSRKACRVARFLEPGSESVGESRSRAAFIREQLPLPVTQADVFDAAGNHLGRVDFLWKEDGVIGEFDGRIKYGRLVPEGSTPEDVLWAEKRREDALRAAGWQIVRWTWDDLSNTDELTARIRAALLRGRQAAAPAGRVRYSGRQSSSSGIPGGVKPRT